MTSGPWYWAEIAAATAIQAWMVAAFVLRLRVRVRLAVWLFRELKPFYWPANLLGYVCEVVRFHRPLAPGNLVTLAVCASLWFFFKDVDDDDRWKRRRRKVASKVAAVAGRLTVVPAEAGAGS